MVQIIDGFKFQLKDVTGLTCVMWDMNMSIDWTMLAENELTCDSTASVNLSCVFLLDYLLFFLVEIFI